MSTFPDAAAARAVLGGFLLRLPPLDPLVRTLVGDEPMVLKLELREPALTVAVDLGARPLAVRFDTAEAGAVALSATADDFHALLGGAMTVGAAITRKRVLVRGSAARLMRVMPFFFLAPYLYPQHLAAVGRADLLPAAAAPPTTVTTEEPVNALVSRLAYAAGFALGLVKTRLARDLDVLAALAALGRGLERARSTGPGPRAST
ncbi:MAG: SCP2 sterol-binding domain-containing protein [Deltaproteobacteria bacterium]|nr:SCP2 sterol-binding domain-containing protein [Deltaproteobacteria bacterium]